MYGFSAHSITERRCAGCSHQLTSHNQGLKEFRQTGFITYQIKLRNENKLFLCKVSNPKTALYVEKKPWSRHVGPRLFLFLKEWETSHFLFEKTIFIKQNKECMDRLGCRKYNITFFASIIWFVLDCTTTPVSYLKVIYALNCFFVGQCNVILFFNLPVAFQ